jgi:hypothetical protein
MQQAEGEIPDHQNRHPVPAEARAIERDFSLQFSAMGKKRTNSLQVESVLPKTCKENRLYLVESVHSKLAKA